MNTLFFLEDNKGKRLSADILIDSEEKSDFLGFPVERKGRKSDCRGFLKKKSSVKKVDRAFLLQKVLFY